MTTYETEHKNIDQIMNSLNNSLPILKTSLFKAIKERDAEKIGRLSRRLKDINEKKKDTSKMKKLLLKKEFEKGSGIMGGGVLETISNFIIRTIPYTKMLDDWINKLNSYSVSKKS